MSPSALCHMLESTLYEKRFGPWFVEPIVAGLEGEDNTPFVAGMDLLGCSVYADDFVVAGTSAESMFGVCESLFRPDLEEEALFETLSQCLLASVYRDALAGWGAVVHIMTPAGVRSRRLKARMD